MKALSVSSFLFWRDGSFRSVRESAPAVEPDGLEAFAVERSAEAAPRAQAAPGRGQRWIVGALAAVALVEAPVAGLWLYDQIRPDPMNAAAVPRQPDIHALPLAAAAVVPEPAEPAALAAGATSVANGLAPQRATLSEPDRAVTAPLAVGGWVSLKTSVPMQVFEDGRLVGTTEVDRIMLPVGTHRLEIVSDSLGYRTRQEVAVRAGQTSNLRLDLPTGTLALNAQPWAEVWIDGERVGETPLGNLTRTIGAHEVVFRHPDLGEKRQTVTVTLKEPARVGVDLRSK